MNWLRNLNSIYETERTCDMDMIFGNLNNSDLKNVIFEFLLLVFMDTCSISDDDENGTESRSYFLFYVYVYVNHPESAAFCLSF